MAAPVVFSNGFFAISTASGSAASAHFGNVIEVDLPIAFEELEDNVMGDSARGTYPGVQTGDAVTVTLKQDFAASSVDAKLWAIFNGKAYRNFSVRPVNTTPSATNPSYKWGGYITSYPPASGKFGDKLTTQIKIKVASGSSITRSSDS